MVKEGRNYIISFRDLLEFSFGFFFVVRVLIRMPLHGQFAISFLKLVIISTTINLKNLIVIHPHLQSSSSSQDFTRVDSVGLVISFLPELTL